MAQKAAGVTILVVAHRLSVLPVVDKILVVKEGRLETFGAREDVLKRISGRQAQQVEAKRAT
jgi:ATP-binding cassette subfamily C protein